MPRKPAQQPYSIGKGKPPKDHQWKKGQPSPNPLGRPKGSTRESHLQKMLKKKAWVTGPDGRRVRKPLSEIIDHKLIEAAAKGDFKAIKLINELVIMHERHQRGRQLTHEELLEQAAQDEEREKANQWVQDIIMEYLDLCEDLGRYGITVPGGAYADWVMPAAARNSPNASWAKKYLDRESQAATDSSAPLNQPVEKPGG